MGIRRFLRSVSWTGPRCSGCRLPLEPIQPGDDLPPPGRRVPCTTNRGMLCGALFCEGCRGHWGSALMNGCRNCGGTDFELFQMWRL
jgi:hypothetical protein